MSAFETNTPTDKANSQFNKDGRQIAELIQLCIIGDDSAWHEFFETYGRLIYTIPARFGFSQPDCDEVFQEASLEIIKGLPSIQQPERLSAWIVTITRRTCIRRFQQQANKKIIGLDDWETIELPSTDDGVLSRMQHAEEHVLLYRAMSKLDVRCQELLTDLFLSDEELSYAEISKKLNIPMGSIGPTRQRCIDSLRKELAQIQNQ